MRIKRFIRIAVDGLAVVAFILSLCLLFITLPNTGKLGFDYYAVLVALMAAIFTLLVGWNIYTGIEMKEYDKKYRMIQVKMERELSRVHRKSEYSLGIARGTLSQALEALLTEDKGLIKYSVALNALECLKVFSAIEEFDKCDKTVLTAIDAMERAKNYKFSQEDKKRLMSIACCVQNSDKINGFVELIQLIQK